MMAQANVVARIRKERKAAPRGAQLRYFVLDEELNESDVEEYNHTNVEEHNDENVEENNDAVVEGGAPPSITIQGCLL
jgi:hypothetical protein